MMIFKWLIPLFLISNTYAKNIYPHNYSSAAGNDTVEIITNSIFEELLEATKGLRPPKELEPKKESVNNMSRGKLMVEEMKRRNREALAKKNGINPDEVKSGKDLVKAA